jgi:ATP-dependent DNA helicase DinG
MSQTPVELFGQDGPLARSLHGFSPRAAQRIMAEAVGDALADNGVLVVEAGTGTGKTFAYLVPAILSGKRVIISTGTRNLQDQLFHRDLPLVRKALAAPIDVALLKGRANYLCRHRLENLEAQGVARRDAGDLSRVRAWAGRTRSGDIADLDDIPEDAMIWPRVTSTVDNCVGVECAHYDDCFVVRARRAAQDAEVLVINHHLLFADMALKEEGFGELLPGADAFIIDEAHQLPEVATAFFGMSISSRQLTGLAQDTRAEHLREAGDMSELPVAVDRLEKAIADLRLAFGTATRRAAWHEVRADEAVRTALQMLETALTGLQQWLEVAAPRGKGLESAWRRSEQLAERLTVVTRGTDAEEIQWFETFTRGFSLHLTPLNIAPQFRARMALQPQSWIFTSATLAVGEDFSHFTQRLGLEQPVTLRLDSPFDYANNALLYLPTGLPDPQHPGFTAAVIEAARPVLRASRGRAFILFTSHRALREAAELLGDVGDHTLLVQGSMPRAALLDRFRTEDNAVLLGTGSFWEGVDVRGPALSVVIIDKLPFASPGDPILMARIDALRARGGNPFFDFQVSGA